MHPLVVHINRAEFDVRVDRSTEWGNHVGKRLDGKPLPRLHAILNYETWLPSQRELCERIPELTGKILGCWCAPKACHAELLAFWANPWLPGMTYEESCILHRMRMLYPDRKHPAWYEQMPEASLTLGLQHGPAVDRAEYVAALRHAPGPLRFYAGAHEEIVRAKRDPAATDISG